VNEYNPPVIIQPGIATSAWDDNASYRVLVADDDDGVRFMNAGMLTRSGYQVDSAADGEAAWQALNNESYDLLITDHNMPRLTGTELIKKMRAARITIPVILASGNPPNDEFNLCPWLRPAATLVKPYTVAKLLGTVTEVLRSSHDAPIAAIPPTLGNRASVDAPIL